MLNIAVEDILMSFPPAPSSVSLELKSSLYVHFSRGNVRSPGSLKQAGSQAAKSTIM